MIEEQSYQPNIVVFDDEEDYPEVKEDPLDDNTIYMFDDEEVDQLEEPNLSNLEGELVKPSSMSQQEYQNRCGVIQDRIIFGNLSNFQKKEVPKKQQNFFKEAKERRQSNELIYRKRKSRNVEELIFDPKPGDVKVIFGHQKNNFFLNRIKERDDKKGNQRLKVEAMELSMSDQISQSLTETVMQRIKRGQINGFCVQKKSNLKIEEDKNKSMLKVSNFRQFLYTQLQPNYSIYLLIKRTENGLINSTFKCYFQQNSRFIMSCEKQGLSKYVFSTSEVHIQQDHISYLGKMQTSFFGTDFQMYDAGLDHTKTKMLQHYKKQLASITYSQPQGCIRRMESVITLCDNKSTDFTIMDKEHNIIRNKYGSNSKRSDLCRLISKDPAYDSNDNNYKLDFRGIAGIPSTKNFILENSHYPDALIFGRQDKDTYLMRIKAPLSIMQAVSIGMSSIHHKFL